MNQSVSNFLYKVCSGEKKLCIFGTGIVARSRGMYYLKFFGLDPTCYVDNNQVIVDRGNLYGKPCISPEMLIEYKDKLSCIVCVGGSARTEVGKQLNMLGYYDWVYIDDISLLFSGDDFLAWFIGIERFPKYSPLFYQYPVMPHRKYPMEERIAVYTCITGGYDVPKLPSCYPSNIDYFIVTDQVEAARRAGWSSVISTREVVPIDIDHTDYPLINRYCKMNGKRIFEKYRFSIYIDGKIQVKKDISTYINYISSIGITTFKHEFLCDPYFDGFVVSTLGDYDDYVGDIKKQLRRYALEGFPRQKYQIEGAVIVRDHDNFIADKIMIDWFNEFRQGVRRDQLSFEYILWKNGIDMKDYTFIPDQYSGDYVVSKHVPDGRIFRVDNC